MTAVPIEPWKLDYSWCSRQGPWTPESDVLLEGKAHTGRELARLLSKDLAKLTPGTQTMQDSGVQPGYWNGGVFLYLSTHQGQPLPASNSHHTQIWLHSRGEDAMDSLAWVSQLICELLDKSHQCLDLRWIEHPHHRNYRVRAASPPIP